MTSLTFEHKLENYADLALKVGLNLQAGQRLIIRAPLGSASLVRLITAGAYQMGARLVDVLWNDEALTLARFQYAPRDSFEEFPTWKTDALTEAAEQGDAVLSIVARDPDLLKDQDPELIAAVQRTADTHMLPFRQKAMADALNWSIVSVPEPAWAAKIFPDDSFEGQISKLWDTIFKVCRVDQVDPVAAWEKHLAQLAAKRDFLNDKQFTALIYRAPGTDLTVGLPENHVWAGGRKETLSGIPFIPNVPTEEVFTMPHKDKVNGVVASTRPLSYGGILIDKFSLTFENGRVVKVTAEKGETVLRRLIESDEGASRLGEVALVPYSSPISQTGLLFYNTLFDENAASHLALGRAYRFSVKGGAEMPEEEFAAAGGNLSLAHVDFMMGSKEMDIDGQSSDGRSEPVMRGGEWAF
jgi:aminopeptidase